MFFEPNATSFSIKRRTVELVVEIRNILNSLTIESLENGTQIVLKTQNRKFLDFSAFSGSRRSTGLFQNCISLFTEPIVQRFSFLVERFSLSLSHSLSKIRQKIASKRWKSDVGDRKISTNTYSMKPN